MSHGDGVATAAGRSRRRTRVPMRWIRARDLGLAYAILVLVSVVLVFTQPHGAAATLVLRSSTNVRNLRNQPVLVLAVSAFVMSSPWSLWILPLLFWGYGEAQRWVGRTATVLVAMLGHVFASVFVGVLLTAGIAHHQLSRRIAREPDVGVSYGLAAVLGLLVFRLPVRARRAVTLIATTILLVLIAVFQTFTDLGHLVAWAVGLTVGLAGSRIAASPLAAGSHAE